PTTEYAPSTLAELSDTRAAHRSTPTPSTARVGLSRRSRVLSPENHAIRPAATTIAGIRTTPWNRIATARSVPRITSAWLRNDGSTSARERSQSVSVVAGKNAVSLMTSPEYASAGNAAVTAAAASAQPRPAGPRTQTYTTSAAEVISATSNAFSTARPVAGPKSASGHPATSGKNP